MGKSVDKASFNVQIEEYDVPQDLEELKDHSDDFYSYLRTEVSIIDASVNLRDVLPTNTIQLASISRMGNV